MDDEEQRAFRRLLQNYYVTAEALDGMAGVGYDSFRRDREYCERLSRVFLGEPFTLKDFDPEQLD